MRSPPKTISLVGDSRTLESRHLGERRDGRLDDFHGERCTGSFPEPHAQIEQRFLTEYREKMRVPRLRRAMRSKYVSGRGRTMTDSQCGGGRGDESVGDDGHAAGSGSETESAHGSDLKTTDVAQNSERTPETFRVQSEGPLDS